MAVLGTSDGLLTADADQTASQGQQTRSMQVVQRGSEKSSQACKAHCDLDIGAPSVRRKMHSKWRHSGQECHQSMSALIKNVTRDLANVKGSEEGGGPVQKCRAPMLTLWVPLLP
jgi:hypothetical protein